jgi:hypothetical protein
MDHDLQGFQAIVIEELRQIHADTIPVVNRLSTICELLEEILHKGDSHTEDEE